ncbi:hypothetical protein IH992_04450 [Candidatus Poribacteria bacterium]|nr:hypothetical protein [Candidatus Poribacteria bacterium]
MGVREAVVARLAEGCPCDTASPMKGIDRKIGIKKARWESIPPGFLLV